MNVSEHIGKPIKALNGLELHYVGDIAIIVMDCGENRLNLTFVKGFNELMDDIESNSSCKGLITTGKGKFYSNGLDLKWLATQTAEDVKEFIVALQKWLLRLLLFPLPTVAALNGHTFAGGALVAFAHDLRVQNREKGWLCFNEVWINRQFSHFHLLYLRTKLGRAYCDALVLGKRYTAREALNDGLVSATPSSALLLSESIHLLKSLYGNSGYPRESLHLMKADVYRDAVAEQQSEIQKAEITSVTENPFVSKL
ncbi:enoyl-coa delta isomerase 3-like [Plakobranchus ocellatus]|uniref:Enoyl-coa delta isomerase 3-like n=1 Tax=Plakobranchus ocellatus TaxID=259542 RepID=A0AAV4DQU2_9GAST|nr:enoyl-coa delta isomerase 3-like [Plakobranchus ocellatus]